MVIILVVFSFIVLIAIGAVMEYGTKKVTENQKNPVISVNHVFAQDGGVKLDSEKKENKNNKEEN